MPASFFKCSQWGERVYSLERKCSAQHFQRFFVWSLQALEVKNLWTFQKGASVVTAAVLAAVCPELYDMSVQPPFSLPTHQILFSDFCVREQHSEAPLEVVSHTPGMSVLGVVGNNTSHQILALCQWMSASDMKAERQPDMFQLAAICNILSNYCNVKSYKGHIGQMGGEVDGSNKLWSFTLEPTVQPNHDVFFCCCFSQPEHVLLLPKPKKINVKTNC